MFKRFLLCYDGSAIGRRALKRGAELAILLNAHVDVLAVLPEGALSPAVAAGALGHSCIMDPQTPSHTRLLEESIAWLKERGVTAQGHLASGNTIERIAEYTQRLSIDLIVLGHYPQPAGGFWWSGSQRVSLADRTRCCVFVAVDSPDAA
ncbi:MAG: universal stress protein [Gammaproteobacteria bacterium]|nr:universal stress protein [Gammaproteobacteria bacterium]MDE2347710.1 universal stress protein [Gammaproteobacteria bacterium]